MPDTSQSGFPQFSCFLFSQIWHQRTLPGTPESNQSPAYLGTSVPQCHVLLYKKELDQENPNPTHLIWTLGVHSQLIHSGDKRGGGVFLDILGPGYSRLSQFKLHFKGRNHLEWGQACYSFSKYSFFFSCLSFMVPYRECTRAA